jgi:hypothetical protein
MRLRRTPRVRAAHPAVATEQSISTGTTVKLWFDPSCPWCWITSRWLLEVQRVRPVDIELHVMSLYVLNENKDVSEFYREFLPKTLGPVRILVAAQRAYGRQVLAPLYTAYGTRIHVNKQERGPELDAAVLAEVGLDPSLAAAATSEAYDFELRASHHEGMDPVGDDVGTPVLHYPGPDGTTVAIFGPVVTPAPKGEAAGRLWDGVIACATTPGFFELKRTRTVRPSFD